MTNATNDSTPERFTLEDTDGQPFTFTGTCLTDVSSQHDDQPKPRWMEMRVYRTTGGSYILEIVGQTTVPGEVVKNRAKILRTADELIEALHTEKDGDRYLTYTARDALEEVAELDDDVRAAWRSRVREVA